MARASRMPDTGNHEHQHQDAAPEIQVGRQVEHQGQDAKAHGEGRHQLQEEGIAQAFLEIDLVHAQRRHAEHDRGRKNTGRHEEVVELRYGELLTVEKTQTSASVERANQDQHLQEQAEDNLGNVVIGNS